MFSNSPKRELWMVINLWEGAFAKAFSTPTNLAERFLFFQKMFSKTSLFQIFALFANMLIAWHTFWRFPLQASLTIFENPSWLSQTCWKRKGLTPLYPRLGTKDKRRRQWSESMRAKWETKALGKHNFHSEFTQTLSNLCWIRSNKSLQLVHVNFALEKPRSRRLQKSIQLIYSETLLLQMPFPPNFSSSLDTSLKSSITTQGRLCLTDKVFKLSHKKHLSLTTYAFNLMNLSHLMS